MQRAYQRVLASMALVVGLSAGCKMQESEAVTDLKSELSKITRERDKLATENATLNANLDTLRRDNEELRKQAAGK